MPNQLRDYRPDLPNLPVVYVAGPYTHPDPVASTHTMIEVATELLDGGAVIPLVPHLTLLWHLVTPRPVDYWYDYDLYLLERCDAVYRLPGPSEGADREVAAAASLGKPTFFDKDTLLGWARGSWRNPHEAVES